MCIPGVSQFPVSPRAFVLHSLLGLNIMPLLGVGSSISTSCDSQIWMSSTTHGRRLKNSEDHLLTPFNGLGFKGWVTWELIQGLGILVHSLLVVVYLQSSSFIGNIFYGMIGFGVAFFQTGQTALGWPLEGVRFWKLNRTYPGEKLPPFFLPTQGCCFPLSSPHSTSWQYPTSQSDGNPLRGSNDPFSYSCAGTTAISFLIKFKFINAIIN